MVGCLMIHGYTGGPYEVEPLADYLRKHTAWDIRVPTLPGHGDPLELDQMTYDEWIHDAEKHMDELKKMYDEIYVIGFSMGGMIASYLAATYEIDKLVLLAAARKYVSWRQITSEIIDIVTDAMRGRLGQNKFLTNFLKKREQVPLRANFQFARLVRFTKPYLKKIHVPVLMVHGKRDPVVPSRALNYLDKEIPSETKELVLFDQSEHRICLGKDQATINMLVYNFLSTTDH